MLSNYVMKPLTRLDAKNPQHVDNVWTTMYEMVMDMEPRSRLMMMSNVMPRMMEKCFESAGPHEMISSVREVLLRSIESCYVKMKRKQRKRMISMCRELLDDIERVHDRSPTLESRLKI